MWKLEEGDFIISMFDYRVLPQPYKSRVKVMNKNSYCIHLKPLTDDIDYAIQIYNE